VKGDIILIVGALATILGFLTAVMGFVNQRRALKAVKLAEGTAAKVQTISVNVDGQLSALLARQAQLVGAMHEADVPIPPKPPEIPPVVMEEKHALYV
jgi:hypothetical protein